MEEGRELQRQQKLICDSKLAVLPPAVHSAVSDAGDGGKIIVTCTQLMQVGRADDGVCRVLLFLFVLLLLCA